MLTTDRLRSWKILVAGKINETGREMPGVKPGWRFARNFPSGGTAAHICKHESPRREMNISWKQI